MVQRMCCGFEDTEQNVSSNNA